MRGRELLTEEQRDEFMRIPSNDYDLGAYYTFSQYDHEIINKHRRDYNRLGFAVQLALLRFPGWSLYDPKIIPDSLLNYIAKQIGVQPDEFSMYTQRETTRWEHIEEIRQIYGYRNFTAHEEQSISQIMVKYALENGNAQYLLTTVIEELRKQKIILPAMTTLERVVLTRQRSHSSTLAYLTSSCSKKEATRFLVDWIERMTFLALFSNSFSLTE